MIKSINYFHQLLENNIGRDVGDCLSNNLGSTNITDLTYTKDGLFATFWPETPQGQEAWSEIAKQNGGVAKVLVIHLDSALYQLRQAGYVVKCRRSLEVDIDEAQLLSALLGD